MFENTSTLSQLPAAGRPGREAEGLLRLSSPLSLPGGQGCRVTFRLQAPCHASPAGLLLMNNKWAFLIHLLGTSCHYKPFCFFRVVVMYHLAQLDVILEKVTKGMCALPQSPLPPSHTPVAPLLSRKAGQTWTRCSTPLFRPMETFNPWACSVLSAT